jgi:SAM-dependent methyltransferase
MRINNVSLSGQLTRINGFVVDLGCGETPYKTDILKHSDFYVGVDWKHSLHNQLGVDVYANLVVGLPFVDRCIDTVVSFQVMEHLSEPKIFLLEAFRILKSGGTIIITVPFMWHVHEAPYDYYRYTRYGLHYLLSEAGFADIEICENTGFWQMWALKFNYHTARFAPGPLKVFWIPIWWLGQIISPLLDKIDKHPQETASYTAVAKKP